MIDSAAFVTIAAIHVSKLQIIDPLLACDDEDREESPDITSLPRAHSVISREDSEFHIELSPSANELPKLNDLCETGQTLINTGVRLGIVVSLLVLLLESPHFMDAA
jgi:hypothetical protein